MPGVMVAYSRANRGVGRRPTNAPDDRPVRAATPHANPRISAAVRRSKWRQVKGGAMSNPWKYATIGIFAVTLTALTSSVMTAYVMRPTSAEIQSPASEVDPGRAARESRPAVTSRREGLATLAPEGVAAPRLSRSSRESGIAVTARPVLSNAPGEPREPVSPTPALPLPPAPIAAAPAPVAEPAVSTPAPTAASPTPVLASATPASASTSSADDCATGGDRAWRIAKPGALGGLLGAALGAAGGAIADGGKAAGTGALLGAGVGAVAGGAYGAYRTQQDCGTILGSR